MPHTPDPWHMKFDEEWPFSMRVIGANGNEVMQQPPAAYSTEAKSRDDCRQGVGFPRTRKPGQSGLTRQQASEAVAEQEANGYVIAAAPLLLAKCEKLVAWLNRMAKACDERARRTGFPSLSEAYTDDAQSYRTTAADIQAVIVVAKGGK